MPLPGMRGIPTKVCTTDGCCNTDGDVDSAWTHAAEWWCCTSKIDQPVRDAFCGTCCMPCQIGVLESKVSGDPTCPSDCAGFGYCLATGFCMAHSPPCAVLIEACVAEGDQPNCAKTCSACLWILLAPFTCAHCIVAQTARQRQTKNSINSAYLVNDD